MLERGDQDWSLKWHCCNGVQSLKKIVLLTCFLSNFVLNTTLLLILLLFIIAGHSDLSYSSSKATIANATLECWNSGHRRLATEYELWYSCSNIPSEQRQQMFWVLGNNTDRCYWAVPETSQSAESPSHCSSSFSRYFVCAPGKCFEVTVFICCWFCILHPSCFGFRLSFTSDPLCASILFFSLFLHFQL